MEDGPVKVVCQITVETLCQFGRTIGLTEPTQIFETGRAAIERAASDKYDRTSRCPYEVLTVTIDDLGLDDA
jgi:hypothetical protein